MAAFETFLSTLRGILDYDEISRSPATLPTTLTYVATSADFCISMMGKIIIRYKKLCSNTGGEEYHEQSPNWSK